ncbi:hypothetical protein FRC19_010662 [Serendipita sp. 401]|nr:hypothetical protein FRC19_010662 [Serendipita sp. 401]
MTVTDSLKAFEYLAGGSHANVFELTQTFSNTSLHVTSSIVLPGWFGDVYSDFWLRSNIQRRVKI